MLRIGITGTGSLVGQAIIKCIKSSKYFSDSITIGFDYIDNTVGSNWVEKNYRLSDILDRNNNPYEKIVDEIIEVILKENIQILFRANLYSVLLWYRV